MTERASALARKRNAIKLHPVVDQPEAKLFGDLALKFFQIGIDKLDHLARFDIDQMIVMCVMRGFIARAPRSEEHTSELQSLMRISYAVFCLKKKNKKPL